MNPLVQSCSHSRKSYDRYMTWTSGNSPIKLGSDTLLLHFLDYLSHRITLAPLRTTRKKNLEPINR